jgi:hypothetical protein
MPTQPSSNLNNRKPQPTHNTNPTTFQVLPINLMKNNGMSLHSRRKLHNPPPLAITKHFEHLEKLDENDKQEEKKNATKTNSRRVNTTYYAISIESGN